MTSTWSVIERFGSYMPMVGNVIQCLKEVRDDVKRAEKNDSRFRKLRAQLGGAVETFEARSRHDSNRYPFGQQNTENLMYALEKIHIYLEKSKRSSFRQIMKAKQLTAEIKELEDELNSALIGITAFMEAQRPVYSTYRSFSSINSSDDSKDSGNSDVEQTGEGNKMTAIFPVMQVLREKYNSACERCYNATYQQGHQVQEFVCSYNNGSFYDRGQPDSLEVPVNYTL
ncbi:3620_t:CDS:2 [Ambispora leptoticha]|uniref:3620_t:CDS:1 n=1 Tax=Ambispora leptoticha TaxID=144679 RepID=A0A9N9AGK8_9GLOM|nr:3620_t:CDS:2 [Ambispora leptoticha]